MKIVIVDPDFKKSSELIDHKKRLFNQCVIAKQMIDIFETQKSNYHSSPNYRVWCNHVDALKAYFNAMLKVCIEVHGYKTKYTYLDVPDEYEMPPFTELTYRSHRAFLIDLNEELYGPKFPDDKGFNNGCLIWEYKTINKFNEEVLVSEDRHGRYDERKQIIR